MSTDPNQTTPNNQNSLSKPTQKSLKTSDTLHKANDQPETPFIERNIEEAEDVSVDENGFSRTPNGSFWDTQGEYFNREGFDKHGGFYDKYMVYIPGPGYDEKKGMYKDEEEILFVEGKEKTLKNENDEIFIRKLKEQEYNDTHVVNDVNNLEEDVLPEDEDYVEEKNDNTFDEEEIKNIIDETKLIDEKSQEIRKDEKEDNKEKEIGGESKNTNNETSSKPTKENKEKNCINASNNENEQNKEMTVG